MNETRVYIDTSAYFAMLVGERRGVEIKSFLIGKVVCSSILLLLEAERNLVRLSREKKLRPDEYANSMVQLKEDRELFLLKDVSVELCLTNLFPPVQIPKTNDLIHLRTALWFRNNGGLDIFVTLDENQKRAAIDFGLQVFT
ncbi:MAG: PIN domain-containing protein [Deltaproteobacteria bacterium]|nr:PIN domain-containing protein [Deltaproteobacteria bacterium]